MSGRYGSGAGPAPLPLGGVASDAGAGSDGPPEVCGRALERRAPIESEGASWAVAVAAVVVALTPVGRDVAGPAVEPLVDASAAVVPVLLRAIIEPPQPAVPDRRTMQAAATPSFMRLSTLWISLRTMPLPV
jgi:hypothetical protein